MKTFAIVAWVVAQVIVLFASIYLFVKGIRFRKSERSFSVICFIFACIGFILLVEALVKIS